MSLNCHSHESLSRSGACTHTINDSQNPMPRFLKLDKMQCRNSEGHPAILFVHLLPGELNQGSTKLHSPTAIGYQISIDCRNLLLGLSRDLEGIGFGGVLIVLQCFNTPTTVSPLRSTSLVREVHFRSSSSKSSTSLVRKVHIRSSSSKSSASLREVHFRRSSSKIAFL